MVKYSALALVMSSALVLPTYSVAQTPPAVKPSLPSGVLNLSDKVDKDLAAAHSALKIQPSQEKEWVAYANVRRQDVMEAQKHIAEMQKASIQGLSARMGVLEMLQQQRQRVTESEIRLDALIAATKSLYSALTPEQLALADEALMPRRPTVTSITTPPGTPSDAASSTKSNK